MKKFRYRFKGSDFLLFVRDLLTLIFDPDKTYELTITEFIERRSLRANNYSYALTDKLAEKMLVAGVKLSKEEMHAEMIFRYGQPEEKNGMPVFVSTNPNIDMGEYYKYSQPIGTSPNGDTVWRIFRGSHTYTKQEMSLFIKGIVEECQEQGIETKTPDEIARMISLMKEVN